MADRDGLIEVRDEAEQDAVKAWENRGWNKCRAEFLHLLKPARKAIDAQGADADYRFRPAAMLVRDVCESDKADPDHPDTVCINVNDLLRMADEHMPASPPPAATLGEVVSVKSEIVSQIQYLTREAIKEGFYSGKETPRISMIAGRLEQMIRVALLAQQPAASDVRDAALTDDEEHRDFCEWLQKQNMPAMFDHAALVWNGWLGRARKSTPAVQADERKS